MMKIYWKYVLKYDFWPNIVVVLGYIIIYVSEKLITALFTLTGCVLWQCTSL